MPFSSLFYFPLFSTLTSGLILTLVIWCHFSSSQPLSFFLFFILQHLETHKTLDFPTKSLSISEIEERRAPQNLVDSRICSTNMSTSCWSQKLNERGESLKREQGQKVSAVNAMHYGIRSKPLLLSICWIFEWPNSDRSISPALAGESGRAEDT